MNSFPSSLDAHSLKWLRWVRHDLSLSVSACDAIDAIAQSYPPAPAHVGSAAFAHRRQSQLRRIREEPRSEALLRELDGIGRTLNDVHFGFELQAFLCPDHLEYHAPMGRFDWHQDHAYVASYRVRKLTMIIQLSDPDAYEGGRLEVFDGGAVELPRERGAILAFPSFVPHRVTPLESGVRKSLVAWFAGAPFR